MKIDDIYNSIDKVKMSKADEEELLNKITDSKTKKTSNKFSYKNKIRIPVAACLAILIVTFSCSSTVRASVHNLGSEFFNFLSNTEKLDTKNIGESGLEQPISLSKNGMTVTLNQCIFSNSEMFLDYTLSANDVKYKVSQDKINTVYTIYDGDTEVTGSLFKKYLHGEGTTDFIDPDTKNMGNKNSTELAYRVYGENFKHKGKTLKIVIDVYEENKNIEFEFYVHVNKLYPEKTKKINKTVIDDKGRAITISEIRNTFSRVILTGEGPLESPNQIIIKDKSGKSLSCPICGCDDKIAPIEFYCNRNSLNNTDEYTIEVYDTNNKLIKEIPVKLENIHK